MRSRFFLSGVMATIVALSGCSSRTESGPSLMPSQVAQARQGQVRTPSSLGAYPISLDAFPSSVGAFPISLDAIPICSSLPLPRTASGSIVGAVVGVVGGLVGGLAGGLLGLGGSDQSNAPSGPSGLGQVTAPVGGLLSTVTKKATCGGSVRTGYGIPAGTPASKLPGYQPLHLQGAYGLRNAAKTLGAGQTVAIVTAYADGTVDSDLAVYRSTFGLPACTVANGCLTIMAPNGAPPANTAWAAETAIDTEMVSAICPLCKIVVVEAKSGNIPDLGNAVDAAAALNPAAISNSYAVPEFSDNVAYAQHWRHANTIVLAGAGDTGYGSNFPATVDTVVAVGGTTLPQNSDGTFGRQTVWTGSGSGCSSYIAKPSWQTDQGCAFRTANDIAVVADPKTGVAGYSSHQNGWAVYGGTSIATPMVAAMFALAGKTSTMQDASGLYDPSLRYAWVLGSNGTCAPTYLCTATGRAYNGPAGNGVPFGLSYFGLTGYDDPYSVTGPTPVAAAQ